MPPGLMKLRGRDDRILPLDRVQPCDVHTLIYSAALRPRPRGRCRPARATDKRACNWSQDIQKQKWYRDTRAKCRLTMVKRCADATRGNFHELFFANPLSKNFAEVGRNALTATGDVEVVLLEDGDAVS